MKDFFNWYNLFDYPVSFWESKARVVRCASCKGFTSDPEDLISDQWNIELDVLRPSEVGKVICVN